MIFKHTLVLSAYLFSIGIYGFITSQNNVLEERHYCLDSL